MKRIAHILTALLAIALASCSGNDLYEDMPSEIQSFVSQYFPDYSIDNFASSSKSYTVILKDGPVINFNGQCKWTRVDGNGSTLPQVLLFNDFPPALYEYLQDTSNTGNVFVVWRNSRDYVVQLLTQRITYEISTGEILGSPKPDN